MLSEKKGRKQLKSGWRKRYMKVGSFASGRKHADTKSGKPKQNIPRTEKSTCTCVILDKIKY